MDTNTKAGSDIELYHIISRRYVHQGHSLLLSSYHLRLSEFHFISLRFIRTFIIEGLFLSIDEADDIFDVRFSLQDNGILLVKTLREMPFQKYSDMYWWKT